MTNDSKPEPAGSASPAEYDVFCIHSYAGESGPPCGWRGRRASLVRDFPGATRRCPRCGRTTLLDILLPPSPPSPAA